MRGLPWRIIIELEELREREGQGWSDCGRPMQEWARPGPWNSSGKEICAGEGEWEVKETVYPASGSAQGIRGDLGDRGM